MNLNEPTDLKDKENKDKELELEQVKLRQMEMEMELELKRIEQETARPVRNNVRENETESAPESKPPMFLFFCLTFLPPIGIIMLWRRKENIIVKIIFTLYSLFIFSMWMGWISFGLPLWFVFMGQ